MEYMSISEQPQANLPHVLIVDDDKRICELVSRYLSARDFITLTAPNAITARDILQQFIVDVMIVDVMMPHITGTEFIQNLRQDGCDIPAIMLTALGDVEDRIKGLEKGADDYLAKPFEPKELVLRVQALLRRSETYQVRKREIYHFGKWAFDINVNELRSDKNIISLTQIEADLVRALLQSNGEAISRKELAKLCHLDEAAERTIDVRVARLRRKIEDNSKIHRLLKTVRGKGYLLRTDKDYNAQ